MTKETLLVLTKEDLKDNCKNVTVMNPNIDLNFFNISDEDAHSASLIIFLIDGFIVELKNIHKKIGYC